MIHLLLLVLAAVLVLVSAFGVNTPRVNLAWLGVFFWILSELLVGLGPAYR